MVAFTFSFTVNTPIMKHTDFPLLVFHVPHSLEWLAAGTRMNDYASIAGWIHSSDIMTVIV